LNTIAHVLFHLFPVHVSSGLTFILDGSMPSLITDTIHV
jgi:hypothetical protein